MARNKNPEITINRILDTATELFLEKGYENTTIQDIIDSLGDLSKGAIYHHFKSKEEIVEAVSNRFTEKIYNSFLQIKDNKNYTGIESLRNLFLASIENDDQKTMVKAVPNLLKNPKFLSMYINESINEIAPKLVEPIIRKGIEDGSIKTDFPKELAEVIILFVNIWINPLVVEMTKEELLNKYLFFKNMLETFNLPIFNEDLDKKMLARINFFSFLMRS